MEKRAFYGRWASLVFVLYKLNQLDCALACGYRRAAAGAKQELGEKVQFKFNSERREKKQAKQISAKTKTV
jgi:hypothetical protein